MPVPLVGGVVRTVWQPAAECGQQNKAVTLLWRNVDYGHGNNHTDDLWYFRAAPVVCVRVARFRPIERHHAAHVVLAAPKCQCACVCVALWCVRGCTCDCGVTGVTLMSSG